MARAQNGRRKKLLPVAPSIPPKAIPVTLLSGFLGSGKTTLLKHILQTEHGLRIAVVVNDIGAINVDASLIKQTHRINQTQEKVVALQNGCICCTLRGDLLEELVRLAELQSFDYIIIESSGISEPEQVAETFDARLAESMSSLGGPLEGAGLDESLLKVLEQVKTAGGLDKYARLDTTCTVIDAFTMLHDFETADLLSSRRDDVVPEDERTVSDLMVDQIEFADVIVLNKVDMVDAKMKKRLLSWIDKLNHRAKVIETSYGKVDPNSIVNTGMFNLERAQTSYGWLQDLHAMTLREVNGRKMITPKPETEEYNVRNFVYSRQRPFHPLRLFQLVHDKFILQADPYDEEDDENEGEGDEEDDEMEEDQASVMDQDDDMQVEIPDLPDHATVLANKKAHPVFARLFRSKGELFLCTRPNRTGEWSQAGSMLTIRGGRLWFCTLPEEEYLTGSSEIDKLVKFDIAKGGEWGDRRQEIVFIGEDLDIKSLEGLLDACLLTDDELDFWAEIMRQDSTLEEKMEILQDRFDDGFPDWDEEEEHPDGPHSHAHADDSHAGHSHTIRPTESVKRAKHTIARNGVVH